MQRFFIKLSYNGTKFHGWQRQKNAHSVQQEIENKLSIILQQQIEIMGCGRTDTGVHASEYYAHFDAEVQMESDELSYKLNCMLPNSIAISKILSVTESAHARFDAEARSYEYIISKVKDPFKVKMVHEFKHPLDIKVMNEAASLFLKMKDFKTFCKAGSGSKTTICDVRFAKWTETESTYVFNITADRFLRNMVRAIVGTLMDVGLGNSSIDEFKQILKSKDRVNAGSSAPASGLYLTKIDYPKSIFN